MTTLVRSVIAAAIASRSCRPSGSDRHPDVAGAGRGDRDRVGLEAAPRVDDLVAGLAERLHQLVDQRRPTPVARASWSVPTPSLLGERVVERGVAHVGVAVHLLGGPGGGLDDARQRRVGVLVATTACTSSAPRAGCGGLPATYAGIWDTHARGWGPVMASTYLRRVAGSGPARVGPAAAAASPTATPIAAPETLSMMSVTSHARSMRATWSWISSMPREYAASATQPERHQQPAGPPPREREHQEDPGRDEEQGVQQLLAAAEDPEPAGRRAADVPAAAGRVLVGGDVAQPVLRRDQGHDRRSPRCSTAARTTPRPPPAPSGARPPAPTTRANRPAAAANSSIQPVPPIGTMRDEAR